MLPDQPSRPDVPGPEDIEAELLDLAKTTFNQSNLKIAVLRGLRDAKAEGKFYVGVSGTKILTAIHERAAPTPRKDREDAAKHLIRELRKRLAERYREEYPIIITIADNYEPQFEWWRPPDEDLVDSPSSSGTEDPNAPAGAEGPDDPSETPAEASSAFGSTAHEPPSPAATEPQPPRDDPAETQGEPVGDGDPLPPEGPPDPAPSSQPESPDPSAPRPDGDPSRPAPSGDFPEMPGVPSWDPAIGQTPSPATAGPTATRSKVSSRRRPLLTLGVGILLGIVFCLTTWGPSGPFDFDFWKAMAIVWLLLTPFAFIGLAPSVMCKGRHGKAWRIFSYASYWSAVLLAAPIAFHSWLVGPIVGVLIVGIISLCECGDTPKRSTLTWLCAGGISLALHIYIWAGDNWQDRPWTEAEAAARIVSPFVFLRLGLFLNRRDWKFRGFSYVSFICVALIIAGGPVAHRYYNLQRDAVNAALRERSRKFAVRELEAAKEQLLGRYPEWLMQKPAWLTDTEWQFSGTRSLSRKLDPYDRDSEKLLRRLDIPWQKYPPYSRDRAEALWRAVESRLRKLEEGRNLDEGRDFPATAIPQHHPIWAPVSEATLLSAIAVLLIAADRFAEMAWARR